MIKKKLKKIIDKLPYIKTLVEDRNRLIEENNLLKQSKIKQNTEAFQKTKDKIEIIESDFKIYFDKK